MYEDKRYITLNRRSKRLLDEIGKQTDLIVKSKKYTIVEESRLISMSSLRIKLEEINKPIKLSLTLDDYDTITWLLEKTKRG